jgi:geranylgeranyl pyrophosphate synthase
LAGQNWEETLNKHGDMIEKRTHIILKREAERGIQYHSFIGGLYQALREYVLRKGKRLASTSALLTYKGFTGKIDDRILDVCAGLELYRHAILVHDDLVDRDETRRRGPTLHAAYAQSHDARLGEGLAVFAGNILYTLALKTLMNSGFERDKLLQAIALLNDAFQDVNESQSLDLLFEYKNPGIREWYAMASKRASSLFKASLGMGAILANAPSKDARLLVEAAEHMGYCFDVQDDIIDTFASEEQYGRKPGGDLAKRKKPLHLIYTYRMAGQRGVEALKRALLKPTLNLEGLAAIREVISGCGALEKAKKRSKKHAETAKKLLSETSLTVDVKGFFNSFIDYLTESLDWYR